MIISYLKMALRSFGKNKLHTTLNILGFSIGLAATILVSLFALNQLTMDQHQPDFKKVYRVHQDMSSLGLAEDGAINPRIPLLMKNHSQVEDILLIVDRFFLQFSGHPFANVVKVNDQEFKLRNFYNATSNLTDFVDIKVIVGDINKALKEPNLIALSQSEALRIFGRNDILGEILTYTGGSYQVGAVFKDLTSNTHFAFDVLATLPNLKRGPFGSHVYMKLNEGVNPSLLATQMTNELHKRAKNPNFKDVNYLLVPLSQLHFKTSGQWEMKQGSTYLALQVSVVLSILLLIIASVNFINFNIAGAVRRAKEVGVRKSLGATKKQLITQFLIESALVVTFSDVIALALVEMLMHSFNGLLGSNLFLDYSSFFMIYMVCTLLCISLISGLYPALFISAFSAKRVLSGDLSRGKVSVNIRKFTLFFQAAVAIGLISSVIILYQQMSLVKQVDVGYEKENRLVIRELPSELLFQKDGNAFLSELKNLSSVKSLTLSDTDYATEMAGGMHYTWPNGETYDGMLPGIRTGFNPVKAMGLKLLAGRDFSQEYKGDWYQENAEGKAEIGIIISKSMVTLAGYQNAIDVIGLKLIVPKRNITATIVGVVDDIRLGSVNKPKLPMSFLLGLQDSDTANIILEVNNDNKALIEQVSSVLFKYVKRNDIETLWLKDEFLASHKNEFKTLSLLVVFSPLAIFLTVLGTFGLASFATLRRQKEIAIRKVLGASRFSLVNVMAKEFLLLISMSIAVAFPLTYWLVGDWLANFNERVDQSIWVYLLASIIIAAITWCTVASLAFKAANTRPSLILRDE